MYACICVGVYVRECMRVYARESHVHVCVYMCVSHMCGSHMFMLRIDIHMYTCTRVYAREFTGRCGV